MSPFAKIKITDAHVHLYFAKNVDALMAQCELFGYSAANVASLSMLGESYLAQNALGLLWKSRHPKNGFFFGGLEYHWPGTVKSKIDPAAQARRLIALGCDGMKMLEGKPSARKDIGVALDSPMFDEYYAFLEAEGIPLLSHVADWETFWDIKRVPKWAIEHGWFYGDGTYVSQQQLFAETKNVLRKFPKLKIFFAHLFFLFTDVSAARRMMDEFPNVYFDICPGIEMYWTFYPAAAEWRKFFIEYQDRLIYGTDMNDRNTTERDSRMDCVRRFLETDEEFGYRKSDHLVKGIALEPSVLEKIYRKNFERIGCRKPKALNVSAAIELCREMAERARQIANPENRRAVTEEIDVVLKGLAGK